MSSEPRDYSAKRSFEQTPEPPPEVAGDVEPGAAPPGRRFVIHQHHARRLHFDLRLEMFNGQVPVLVSWAVPKNLPIEKGVRALAIHVEDHPFEYGEFSGTIPAGNYGAGEVRIFDSGEYDLIEQAGGKLTFRLAGRRMRGVWHLVRTGGKSGKDWLAMLRSWEGEEPKPLPAGDPMEPVPAEEIFDDPGWAFEPRLEGRRRWAMCDHRSTKLWSPEAGSETVPGTEKLHERLVALGGVLDGVLVNGSPHDSFVAVDLLYLDGEPWTDRPYSVRRRMLEESVVAGDGISVVTSVRADGRTMLQAARELGLPGVVAKRLDSSYEPGPSRAWRWIRQL